MMIEGKWFYVKCFAIFHQKKKIKQKLSTKKLHFGHFFYLCHWVHDFSVCFFLTIMKCQIYGNSEISTAKKKTKHAHKHKERTPDHGHSYTHPPYAHTSHHTALAVVLLLLASKPTWYGIRYRNFILNHIKTFAFYRH